MKAQMQPMVSVLMITYNHEKYVAQSIENILKQSTNFKFEFVIGEDFSTDSTRVICEKYAAEFPSMIKLLPSSFNLGMMPNFVRTLKACSGRYIAVCEGDDFWTDNQKLQKQFELLERNPNVKLCFHLCRELNELSGKYSEVPVFSEKRYTFFDFAKRGCFIHTCSIMFRNLKTGILDTFAAWTYQLSGADYLLYLLCTKDSCEALPMNDVMGVYRMHPGGSWTGLSNVKRVELMDNDLSLYKSNLNLNNEERIYLNFQLKRIILGYLAFYFSCKSGFIAKWRWSSIFFFNRIYFIFGPGYISSLLASIVYPTIKNKAIAMKEIYLDKWSPS